MAKHKLVQADCIQWLAEQASKGERVPKYDLIFLDPPTFSNSKRMGDVFDVQEDQEDLITQAVGLLRPGGRLYFSTNRRGFKLSPALQAAFNPLDITE